MDWARWCEGARHASTPGLRVAWPRCDRSLTEVFTQASLLSRHGRRPVVCRGSSWTSGLGPPTPHKRVGKSKTCVQRAPRCSPHEKSQILTPPLVLARAESPKWKVELVGCALLLGLLPFCAPPATSDHSGPALVIDPIIGLCDWAQSLEFWVYKGFNVVSGQSGATIEGPTRDERAISGSIHARGDV